MTDRTDKYNYQASVVVPDLTQFPRENSNHGAKDGWQGMESAPRIKGARCLIWDGELVHSVQYEPPYWYPRHIENPEQWIQVSESGRATSFDPVMWRPLPEPPK